MSVNYEENNTLSQAFLIFEAFSLFSLLFHLSTCHLTDCHNKITSGGEEWRKKCIETFKLSWDAAISFSHSLRLLRYS